MNNALMNSSSFDFIYLLMNDSVLQIHVPFKDPSSLILKLKIPVKGKVIVAL